MIATVQRLNLVPVLFCLMTNLSAETLRFSDKGSWGDPVFRDVVIENGHAFALSQAGLTVFNVADSSPVAVGYLDHRAGYMLSSEGSRLYLVGSGDITILDIKDPRQPQEIGRVTIDSSPVERPEIDGHLLAWQTPYKTELFLFDMTDPKFPQKRILPGVSDGFTLAGQQLHTVDSGVYRVLDLEGTPLFESERILPRGTTSVKINDGLLYTFNDTTLRIFSISDPAAVVNVGELTVELPYISDIRLDGHTLYLNDYQTLFAAIDVTDPNNPTLMAEFEITAPYDVADGIVFSGHQGLNLFDLRTTPPTHLNSTDIWRAGTVSDLLFDGDHLFVAHNSGGVRILRPVEDRLEHVSSLEQAGVRNLSLRDRVLWASGEQTSLIDVEDPANPSVLREFDRRGTATTASSGFFLLTSELSYFNLDQNPVQERYYPLGYLTLQFFGMAMWDQWLYLGERGLGVYTWDQEQILGVHGEGAAGSLSDIITDGDLLFTTSAGKGVTIYSLEDPSHPRQRGSFPHLQAYTALRDGDHLYVGEHQGLSVLDISQPNRPRLTGRHRFTSPVTNIALAGNRVYTATGDIIRILTVREVAHESVIPWVVANDAFTSMVSIYNQERGMPTFTSEQPILKGVLKNGPYQLRQAETIRSLPTISFRARPDTALLHRQPNLSKRISSRYAVMEKARTPHQKPRVSRSPP